MTEAELLFTDILNCDRLSLYLNKEIPLDKEKATFISSALERRIKGEPIQYILGKTEFMGLEFKVNRDVFIPRPETEILVETVIRYSSCVMRHASCINVLDIGTGSGCIAISLTKFLSNVRITATDISQEALKVAKDNAQVHNVINKILFIKSNLFSTYNLTPNTYDLIVNNPPYIPSAEIDNLQPEIKYESRIALDGGVDGLDFYRRIIRDSTRYLKKGGFLAVEMGFGQRYAIENIFQSVGNFEIIEVVKDYNNIERVIIAQNAKRKVQNLNG